MEAVGSRGSWEDRNVGNADEPPEGLIQVCGGGDGPKEGGRGRS